MQLPLAISLREANTFDNFINAEDSFLQTSLRQFVDEHKPGIMYLWGAHASGKTHLLQAVCHQASQAGQSVSYLPLQELVSQPPLMLEGLESVPLICVDDMQAVVGRQDWQQALFNLYNRVFEQGGRMLFAALASPAELGLDLADLVSRLQSGPVFHVQALDDSQKITALQQRAAQRGLQLEVEPARYLINRFPRDLNALFEVLDTLDQESLIKQRRITIPFIREVFAPLD